MTLRYSLSTKKSICFNEMVIRPSGILRGLGLNPDETSYLLVSEDNRGLCFVGGKATTEEAPHLYRKFATHLQRNSSTFHTIFEGPGYISFFNPAQASFLERIDLGLEGQQVLIREIREETGIIPTASLATRLHLKNRTAEMKRLVQEAKQYKTPQDLRIERITPFGIVYEFLDLQRGVLVLPLYCVDLEGSGEEKRQIPHKVEQLAEEKGELKIARWVTLQEGLSGKVFAHQERTRLKTSVVEYMEHEKRRAIATALRKDERNGKPIINISF